MQIEFRQNRRFPGIEVKFGENQYSRHSHIHRAWSFSYVLHGKTVVTLGTWKSELEEDQFIAIPPGVPHLCSPETDFPFSFAVLYIPVECLDARALEFSYPRTGKLDSAFALGLIERFANTDRREDLEAEVQRLRDILKRDSSPLNEDWGKNLLERSGDSVLKERESEKSRFQIYRHTRKLFGIGGKKVSTIEKMEQAKELMSEGLDLVDVALECGFYDQSHFSKVFKLYTGLTPSQYMSK